VCCSVLQCVQVAVCLTVAVRGSVLQYVVVCCRVLRCTVVFCTGVFRCVAMCGSMLQ